MLAFKAVFTLLLRLFLAKELRRREFLLFAIGFVVVACKELCLLATESSLPVIGAGISDEVASRMARARRFSAAVGL